MEIGCSIASGIQMSFALHYYFSYNKIKSSSFAVSSKKLLGLEPWTMHYI
jgi:hypothetical protein